MKTASVMALALVLAASLCSAEVVFEEDFESPEDYQKRWQASSGWSLVECEINGRKTTVLNIKGGNEGLSVRGGLGDFDYEADLRLFGGGGALVHGVLAPTMDGPFADNIGRREDDPSSKRVPKWSRSPRISDHCTPPVLVDHPGAHRRRVQVVNRWDQPRHAARFSVTTGKCRRLPWKVISHVNRTPGLPLTSVTGFAHGELRGQSVRGSNRG